jgi:TonB family protein
MPCQVSGIPFLRRSAPQHLSSKLLLKLKLFFGLAAAMALWPLAPLHCSAQAAGNQDSAARVLAIKIFPPEYPPLARTAGISGDVTLKVIVHHDGTVYSVMLVSGHPMLSPAAVESARQSTFECVGCGTSNTVGFFTYSFDPNRQEADPDPCCCTDYPGKPLQNNPRTPAVSQSGNHITIKASPICMCPNPTCPCNVAWVRAQSRYRSAKCLYLWKCGFRVIHLE